LWAGSLCPSDFGLALGAALSTHDRRPRMAIRQPVYGTCKAPKVFGSPCGHRLEGAAQSCEAELPRGGVRVRCAAWPMPGLPFCVSHDPVAAALRRDEQQTTRVRVAAVRWAISRTPAHVQARILDFLVAERRVELGAVEAAVRAYPVIG
jgi:hypothetical protein